MAHECASHIHNLVSKACGDDESICMTADLFAPIGPNCGQREMCEDPPSVAKWPINASARCLSTANSPQLLLAPLYP
jgi:hypothetical protein